MTTPTREQVVQLVEELESGSNWLSGKHNVYSYNRQPKIAAMLLKALVEQGLPELLSELRKPHDWKLEGFGHYKDVTMAKNDAPFRAADVIERLARAELEATIAEQAAEISTLQSKADALVDALETVKRYLSVGNATSAYNYIFIALATYKETTNGATRGPVASAG